MSDIHNFNRVPFLPAELERLQELAYNLRWTWAHESVELFRRLEPDLWEETGHNPVWMLEITDGKRFEQLARNDSFLAHLERVSKGLELYMRGDNTWYQNAYAMSNRQLIAYFSPEYGLTDCLPLYAGGLGVLAGDYLKAASDLGLPLVGVGLLYQEGCFREFLCAERVREESSSRSKFDRWPVRIERVQDGAPVTIEIAYPEGGAVAQVWRAQVGRVPLFLLDTNLPVNTPEARRITERLYPGDVETRLRQEILLGIGGMRALDVMAMRPCFCHMNEGHTAFAALERIRLLMQERRLLSFADGLDMAMPSNIFTTHTPVMAGIDFFPPDLMDRYFREYCSSLGLTLSKFLALGRQNPKDDSEYFSMTVLGLRLSVHRHGVSRLHGEVSRRMWQGLWPNLPQDDVPITSINNGIHLPSWLSNEMTNLYDRYLGPDWRRDPTDPAVWERVDRIPDEELWRTKEGSRAALVAFVRRKLRAQYRRWGAPSPECADEVLDPKALTIGFARRFTSYKRPTLLLHDPPHLAKILGDPDRPVQIVYSGRAHPQDNEGKEIIRQIIQIAGSEEFRRRIVFIEDYDMCVARHLVQGADLWLNTPRPPMEASGTSGMKATANGTLNVSVLDGWWDEAYRAGLGWAIGRGEVYEDHNYQDQIDSSALYDLLEKQIIPLFYDRDPDDLPRGWVCRVKAAIRSICPVYNTHRMARDYMERLYISRHKWARLDLE